MSLLDFEYQSNLIRIEQLEYLGLYDFKNRLVRSSPKNPKWENKGSVDRYIDGLPPCLINEIVSSLESKDLQSLFQSSRFFRNFGKDEGTWKFMIQKNFGLDATSYDGELKAYYKVLENEQKMIEEVRGGCRKSIGASMVHNRHDIQVELHMSEDQKTLDLKMAATFEQISPRHLFEILVGDLTTWIPLIFQPRIEKKIHSCADIGHFTLKLSPQVIPRDFTFHRTWRTYSEEYVIAAKSIPPKSNVMNAMRGELKICGAIISSNGKNGSRLTIYSVMNLNGAIPQWCITPAVTKVVPKLMDRIASIAKTTATAAKVDVG